MPLHPLVEQYLAKYANAPTAATITPDDARAQVAPCPEPRDIVERVDEISIPSSDGPIAARLYTPAGADASSMTVFLHGGGWMLCNVDCYDGLCRTLANASGSRLLSVEYRLSPEHKFPAAVEDAYAAVCWAAQQSKGTAMRMRLAIAGDSAGGNLAAAACLMARDRKGPAIDFQLLVYPITDFSFDTPSYHQNADGYRLTREAMQWFWKHYLAKAADGANPYASPLRAESVTGLPAAAILTVEYDPLRDEGRAYAKRLREAGIAVEELHLDDMIHGFLRHTDFFPQAGETLQRLGAILKRALRAD